MDDCGYDGDDYDHDYDAHAEFAGFDSIGD